MLCLKGFLTIGIQSIPTDQREKANDGILNNKKCEGLYQES